MKLIPLTAPPLRPELTWAEKKAQTCQKQPELHFSWKEVSLWVENQAFGHMATEFTTTKVQKQFQLHEKEIFYPIYFKL